MQYIDCIVCIGVTERKGNIRMDIYWEWAGDMKKKTVRYRKEEAALCDAALSGLLGRGIGGPECVKGGVKTSPFLEGKDGLYRCLSGTYMLGERIGPFQCFTGSGLRGLRQRNRPVYALLYDMEYGQIVIMVCGLQIKTWYLFDGRGRVDVGTDGRMGEYTLYIRGKGKMLQKITARFIADHGLVHSRGYCCTVGAEGFCGRIRRFLRLTY